VVLGLVPPRALPQGLLEVLGKTPEAKAKLTLVVLRAELRAGSRGILLKTKVLAVGFVGRGVLL